MYRFRLRRLIIVAALVAFAVSAIPVSASANGIQARVDPSTTSTVAAGTSALAISAGWNHTCVIRATGTIACWGDNASGVSTPPAGTFTALDAGSRHTCAIRTDATLACWGVNDNGQSTPPTGTFVAVSAGGSHSCGVRTAGTLACWGATSSGQGTPPTGTYESVSAGNAHTCAIRSDHAIVCWGPDDFGESTPPNGSWSTVSAGIQYTCAINLSDTVACWGRGDDGQLNAQAGTYKAVAAGFWHACALKTAGTPACWGNPSYGKATPPAGTFNAVSAGAEHTCGIRTSGWIACWGNNEYGQSVPPLGLRPVVSAGWFHSCSLRPDNTVTCWGDSEEGATIVPVGTYKTVSAGQGFTCAIRTTDALACWGYNGSGQTATPAGTYIAVSAGGNHACAIRAAGTLACWGANTYGQASPPPGTYKAVSAGFRNTCALRALDGWISCWGTDEDGVASVDPAYYGAVSVGAFHACALKFDNSIGCWGYPGDGRTNPPAGTFTEVGAGYYHGCGLRTNATLACWGYNGDHQASPPTGTYITASAGAWHSCALATSGNIICWGWNYYNQATTSEPAASTYVPVAPTRLLDSRSGNGLSGKFMANVARTFQIAGRGPVPANAVAVTGNFTVTRQTSGGFASVTPVATNAPSTSTINFPRGDNRANNVTVVLGPGGKLAAVYKAGAGQTTDFVFDVTGYFLANETGATYTPRAPVRLLDTRAANGLNGTFKARTPRTWQITGRGGIPAGATAITGNLTVTRQTSAGFVTVGPTATANPSTSTLNFPLGDTRANGLTVKLGANGTLSAVYMAGVGTATHLVLDVTGYYMADLNGTRFYPLAPDRVLDSRYGIGLDGTFKANTARTLTVAARVGVPADAAAVTGNLTVTGQTQGGFVSMTQATTNAPSTSTLNFPKGDTRANGVTGPLSGSGTVGLVERAGTGASTHLILDITGYFSDPSSSGSASTSIPGASPERGSGRIGDERNGTWGLSPRDWQH